MCETAKPSARMGTGNYKNITQTPLGNTEQQTHETLILKKSGGDLFRRGAAENTNTPFFSIGCF